MTNTSPGHPRRKKTYEEQVTEANFYHEAGDKFTHQVMLPATILVLVVIIDIILCHG